MLFRCYRPENDNYRWYGAIGRYVCRRWRESVVAFVEDMGQPPGREYTLDRVNTEGHYTCGKCPECVAAGQPANCRWATKETQHRNAKNNLWFTHDGRTLILKDWAREFKIDYHALWNRIFRSGMAFEEAIAALSND